MIREGRDTEKPGSKPSRPPHDQAFAYPWMTVPVKEPRPESQELVVRLDCWIAIAADSKLEVSILSILWFIIELMKNISIKFRVSGDFLLNNYPSIADLGIS
jgi:hypothetical protein